MAPYALRQLCIDAIPAGFGFRPPLAAFLGRCLATVSSSDFLFLSALALPCPSFAKTRRVWCDSV
jgi:hypothetical protein